jgi:HSP20 family protein
MNIVKRGPFSLFDELQRDMNRVFDAHYPSLFDEQELTAAKSWVPTVEVEEDDKSFSISVDLPGVEPEAIEVTAHDNYLRIKGERESKSEDKQLKRTERVYGSFIREFTLPNNADLESISAKSNHGVLELTIPKKVQADGPKRINIERS